jgi:predicted helicase
MTVKTSDLDKYVSELAVALKAGIDTEHTHRPSLKALLEAAAPGLLVTNEPRRVACGMPDLSVSILSTHGPVTVGYVETKQVGASLEQIERDSSRNVPKTPDGRQLKRYRQSLENLIFTDYLEFRWYVGGKRRALARLGYEKSGRITHTLAHYETLVPLLESFSLSRPEPISNPAQLAERMARTAHLVRDVIKLSFDSGKPSRLLNELRTAFVEVLLPDLTNDEFSDMLAQTLIYGLFAARIDSVEKDDFSRADAAHSVSRSNPFLRRLFGTLAGPDLDDEPFVGLVDDLADLLARSDMNKVLSDFGRSTHQRDPLVHFYETFLQFYDPSLRAVRGAFYTPEPVVSFIVRSVDELLTSHFNLEGGLANTGSVKYKKSLDDNEIEVPQVLVLDPACGTGTFLATVVSLVRDRFMESGNVGMWEPFVRQQLLPRLLGFELMMGPYVVAHLKLALQLSGRGLSNDEQEEWSFSFREGERLNIFMTNTLEPSTPKSSLLMGSFISDEANSAADVKGQMPVMVVLGNPPYRGHSVNASEHVFTDPKTGRKKREQTHIGKLVADYYTYEGKPIDEAVTKWLQDDYVKFIRFGQERIESTGYGILAFITNHGYLDNPTFRGMREKLLAAFTDIYVLDLHGSLKKQERDPEGGRDQNVFDIEPGVAIAFFVKRPSQLGVARIFRADLWGERAKKYEWLLSNSVGTVNWNEITPRSPNIAFNESDNERLDEFEQGWPIDEIFPVHSLGVLTKRDNLAVAFNRDELMQKILRFMDPKLSPEATAQDFQLPLSDKDRWNLTESKKYIAATLDVSHVRSISYRPYDERVYYDDAMLIARRNSKVLENLWNEDNFAILVGRQGGEAGPDDWDCVWITNQSSDHNLFRRGGATVCPLYLGGPGTQLLLRQPNLSPAFCASALKQLGIPLAELSKSDGEITPFELFHYVYAILWSKSYRLRFSDQLKRSFPRIPLTSRIEALRSLAELGQLLVNNQLLLTRPLTNCTFPVAGACEVETSFPKFIPDQKVIGADVNSDTGRIYINGDKRLHDGQYFDSVSESVWRFKVGGYPVCEKWLKDRRGRSLTHQELEHFTLIVGSIETTFLIAGKIDAVIDGWPFA